MAKIDNTIQKSKINEAATPQQVTDAIKKRYEVKINYKSDNDPKGSGPRLIEPVAYGTMKGSGNPVIRAFQPFGDTKTKVPHWKMFRLDRIEEWKPLKNRHFDDPSKGQFAKNGYNPTGAEGAFNPNGDASMDKVFVIADFEGAKQRYNQNLKKHNDEVNAKKVEQDPFYNLKKNIKNSIKGDPEIMKRVKEWQKQKEEREKRQQLASPNQQSSKEMASIKDFGNQNSTQTVGPITKNIEDNETVANNTQNNVKKNGYNNVANNGPVYKTDNTKEKEQLQQNTINNTEDLENDNNEEVLNNRQNG